MPKAEEIQRVERLVRTASFSLEFVATAPTDETECTDEALIARNHNPMTSSSVHVAEAMQTIWKYHLLHHKIQETPPYAYDLIFVLGSHDARVADHAVDLYERKLAKKILFSGGIGNLTQAWKETEADSFAKIALTRGVPSEAVLIENKSTNTGENIRFSYALLKTSHMLPNSMILVQKPYMERRTFATFMKQWPTDDGCPLPTIAVSSPPLSFEQYCSGSISKEEIANVMVGDLQRIKVYPSKGFQIEQEIPTEVWTAFETLVANGYNKHLLK